MADPRATYNLSARVRGDGWRGIPTITIAVNAAPPTTPVASARMFFRKTFDSPETALELSTAAGTIVINDAAAWDFTIPPITDFPLKAGKWIYDFETIDDDGFPRTYFGGEIDIWRDVTR